MNFRAGWHLRGTLKLAPISVDYFTYNLIAFAIIAMNYDAASICKGYLDGSAISLAAQAAGIFIACTFKISIQLSSLFLIRRL